MPTSVLDPFHSDHWEWRSLLPLETQKTLEELANDDKFSEFAELLLIKDFAELRLDDYREEDLKEFAESISKGSTVSWNYGSGTGTGKVVKVYKKPIALTLQGTEIKRNGTEDNPALLIEQKNGSRVLKLLSEVKRSPSSDYAESDKPLAKFADGGDRSYVRDGRGRFANKNTPTLKEVRQLLRDQNLDQARSILDKVEGDDETPEEEIQEIRSLVSKAEDSLFLGAKEVLDGKTPKFYENKIQSLIEEKDVEELSSVASKLEDASNELSEINPVLSDKLATLWNLARDEISRIEEKEVLEEEKAYVRQLAKETPFSIKIEGGVLSARNNDKEFGSLRSFTVENPQEIKLIQDKILSVSNVGVRQYLLDQLAGEIKDNEYRLTKSPEFLRMLGIRHLDPKTMDQMLDKSLRVVRERLGGSLEFQEFKREPLAEFVSSGSRTPLQSTFEKEEAIADSQEERLTEELTQAYESALDPIQEFAERIANSDGTDAEKYRQFVDGIYELYGEMDGEAIANTLSDGFAAAYLAGMYSERIDREADNA